MLVCLAALALQPASVDGINPSYAVSNSSLECGIGGLVPWAGKLWFVTYSPHKPGGSDDGLYWIDSHGKMQRHPQSVGGTPANRFIHRESSQLFLGSHVISHRGPGKHVPTRVYPPVRTISSDQLPGRITGTARHLTDPANKVYMVTMEEGLYEVDVHTLDVTEIQRDGNVLDPPKYDAPYLPGYHGKDAYTGQGVLHYVNNGELGDLPMSAPSGCLAEWDGTRWMVRDRRQFVCVTGPGGLYGAESDDDPVWALGWDHKSVVLKVKEDGDWTDYRLPKGSFTHDGAHGWHTEWPRIREIEPGKWFMDMHGLLWQFESSPLEAKPVGAHLKMFVDFAKWGDRYAFACNDASSFDNPFVTRSHSNIWWVRPEELADRIGPREGWASLWQAEAVEAGEKSDRLLARGFPRASLWAVNQGKEPVSVEIAGVRLDVAPGKAEHFVRNGSELDDWVTAKALTDAEKLTVAVNFSDHRDIADGYSDPEFNLPQHVAANGPDLTLNHLNNDKVQRLMPDLAVKMEGEPQPLVELLAKRQELKADEISAYFERDGEKWRIPAESGFIREIVTERTKVVAGSALFELPRANSGGVRGMRAVAATPTPIADMASWRGFFVTAGPDGKLSLSNLDSIWKRTGRASYMWSPWRRSRVKAGETTDNWLLTGYTFDGMVLENHGDESVKVVVEIDPTTQGAWGEAYRVTVPPGGAPVPLKVHPYMSACWLRLTPLQDGILTFDVA